LEKEKEGRDPGLDKTIGQLGIAEYQVNKLRRILVSRLDRTNPVAFSKSSTHAFKCGSRVYKITIEADTFDIGDRPTISHSFINAVKSPAFIIIFTLFSAIICVLALVSVYWGLPALGSFSDREMLSLDKQYSLILDRCAAAIMNDDQPNPRSFGALYSTCNKAIIQLQEFCKEHHIATCEDERIQLYRTVNKPR